MPTSISDFCELFIGFCMNKSMLKHISNYSDEICVNEDSFTAAREKYREETDAVVKRFESMDSLHQVAASLRHCNVEVQYFIFERASLIKCMSLRYPDKYQIVVDCDTPVCSQLSHLLSALWEYTEALCQNNLNSMVSQCYRGIL